MNNLKERKEKALEAYKAAKEAYLKNCTKDTFKSAATLRAFQSSDAFRAFKEAERACMLLGVRI